MCFMVVDFSLIDVSAQLEDIRDETGIRQRNNITRLASTDGALQM
jgi:hypothetical protein